MAQAGQGEIGRVEVGGIRPEPDARARIALTDRADLLEFRFAVAVGEHHVVFDAVALDPDLEFFRQGVDHRYADAVQAARELVVLVVELAAGVQLGQDQFHARNLLFRVNVHGHAAAVVDHLDRTVLECRYGYLPGVARQRLVHAVVDDLHRQVVGAGGIRVHARTAFDGFESCEDLDIFCAIVHSVSLPFFRLCRKPAALNCNKEFASGLRQPQTWEALDPWFSSASIAAPSVTGGCSLVYARFSSRCGIQYNVLPELPL